MSAQTGRAGKPDVEPITPVIIKSGGGGDLSQTQGAPSQVDIEASQLPFKETALGLKWESSQSTLTGRITDLTINDGTEKPVVKNIDKSDELASVTIMYGLDQLMVMESGVPARKDVVLVITSPQVPFNVSSKGEWTDTKTTFPKQITSVVLTVGSEVKLFHECKNADVTVVINFDQNPK